MARLRIYGIARTRAFRGLWMAEADTVREAARRNRL